MIDNQMLTSLSEDPADLFSQLWDQLPENVFDSLEVFDWLAEPSVEDIAAFIERSALMDGTFAPGSIPELLDAADEPEPRIFAILLGLDRAMASVNPFLASHDEAALVFLASRYAETGRLSTAQIPGALLPRCAFPGRPRAGPNTLADAFTSVVRVDEATWRLSDHRQIPSRADFSRIDREAGVIVACVPLLESLDEVSFETSSRGGRRVFRIAPRNTAHVRARVERIVSAVDESGAQVVLLPELTLSDNLLEHWTAAIRGMPPPPYSRVKWIFAGTGNIRDADPPANCGVLLDRRTGEELLVQEKLFPFTLSEEQLSEWELEPYLGTGPIEEDLQAGRRITVTESRLGRITILVCEDLGRTMDLGPNLRAHGISLSLAPVFSKEVRRHHWEHVRAKDYAAEVGAATIVSNSLVIARLMGQHGAVGTSLLHSPSQTDFGSAEGGEDVQLFHLKRPFYEDDSDA